MKNDKNSSIMELQPVTLFRQQHRLLVRDHRYEHLRNLIDDMKKWIAGANNQIKKANVKIRNFENDKARLNSQKKDGHFSNKQQQLEEKISRWNELVQLLQDRIAQHKKDIQEAEEILGIKTNTETPRVTTPVVSVTG